MRIIFLATLAISIATACTKQKNETPENQDSVVVHHDSTVVVQEQLSTPIPVVVETQNAAGTGELTIVDGESVFVSSNQFSFISNPYDFSLDASTIESLLGEGAKTKSESFEAGEGYSAYTYYTVTSGDTEISFYDFAGKHFSTINTPLLPLKYGIKVGMKKNDFLTAIGFDSVAVADANRYRLTDDYGEMQFYFRADSLYRIYAHYEEGD